MIKKSGFFLCLLSLLSIPLVTMSTALAADDREVITVSAEQRDLVLSDMRDFLVAVQDIVLALADGDMATVADVARAMGPGKGRGMSMGMTVPPEFRQMGRGTHIAFLELAQSADAGAENLMAELGTLMSNCTGCHVTYKFVVKP